VVAHALDHRRSAGVAYRESLAGDAVEEDFTAGGAVKNNIADKDALFR
jgi:hypothetical protein